MKKIIVYYNGVDLDNLHLTELFDLSDVEITDGGFSCSNNYLTSLKGAPFKCKQSVVASRNNLTNLNIYLIVIMVILILVRMK